MFVFVLALLFSVLLLLLLTYRCLTAWPRRGVAQITPSMPFGNFAGVFLQTRSFAGILQQLYKSVPTDTRYVGIYAGLRPTLLIRDPALVTTILVTDFQHFHDRGLYIDERNDPLSGNLVLLSGERWRRLRAKLTPAFSAAKLRAMCGCIVAAGSSLEWRLDRAARSMGPVEMHEVVAQFTTNVIASVAFGLDIDCVRNPEVPFRVFGRKIFESNLLNGVRDATGFLFPRLQRLLPFKSIDQDVEDFFVSIVHKNLRHRLNRDVERPDFFQQLFSLWRDPVDGLTQMECVAQAFIFFVAGFETSSTTMAFALFELARNRDVQQKVQLEIDRVLAKHGQELTYEAVHDLKYLDNCIDEILRKYPPLPLLNRECTRDWLIPGTSIIIPEGTPIIIPVHAIQNDAKFYSNPRQFDPDRFAKGRQKERTPTERPYLPFGSGPRSCIAQRLGQIQTKIGLVLLLRGHSFELAGNTESGEELTLSTQNVLLSPVEGVQLTVHRRT